MKALAKDHRERFESVEAFSAALQQANKEEPSVELDILPAQGNQAIIVNSPSTEDNSQFLGTTFYTYRSPLGAINTVAWSPNGTLLAFGASNAVQIWDVTTSKMIFEHYGHTRVNAVAWSPDGMRLASAGSEGDVQVWDVLEQCKLSTNHGPIASPPSPNSIFAFAQVLNPPPKRSVVVNALAWSPDGKYIAAASSDSYAYVWDASYRNTNPTCRYENHMGAVLSISWSPDGKYIASGSSDQKAHVWKSMLGDEIFTYPNHSGPVDALVWLPDSQHICSTGRDHKVILVWRATTGKLMSVYRGHKHWRRALACSPNGALIASGDADNTVHVWNTKSGENMFMYHEHSHMINAVSWSPDGTRIASADNDGTVRIWQAVEQI